MNELFQFNEDFEIEVNPIVYTLVPFKKVLDKYKNKQEGITELSFIAFLCNPKSDFADVRNEQERKEAILVSMVGANKLKLDKVTEEAIQFYKDRNHTTTSLFLDSSLNALDKLTAYLNGVNFTSTTTSGALKYDPKKTMDVIASSPKLMMAIRELREQIKKEQELEGNVRGSGQKGIYEDG
jgi:hypothetical protein